MVKMEYKIIIIILVCFSLIGLYVLHLFDIAINHSNQCSAGRAETYLRLETRYDSYYNLTSDESTFDNITNDTYLLWISIDAPVFRQWNASILNDRINKQLIMNGIFEGLDFQAGEPSEATVLFWISVNSTDPNINKLILLGNDNTYNLKINWNGNTMQPITNNETTSSVHIGDSEILIQINNGYEFELSWYFKKHCL